MQQAIKPKKYIAVLYGITGFLFAFFAKTESDLSGSGNIEWTGKYLLILLLICLLGAAAAVLLYIGCMRLKTTEPVQHFMAGKAEKEGASRGDKPLKLRGSIVFLAAFALDVLAYLPFYLAYYPGISAYDVSVQLKQIYDNAYNDHHPLFHTLLIKLCISSGGGMALCTAIQLILLAAGLAFVIYTLYRYRLSPVLMLIVQACFMLNLFNGFMAVSITKDTIFTAFFLIFIC